MEEKQNGVDTPCTCRKCGEIKIRNQIGMYPNGRDKKYADEHGNLWSGRQCPECQKLKMRSHMKAKRNPDVQ